MKTSLSSIAYDLRRFGLTPAKIPGRFRQSGVPVFANSIPKSGTHLLESLLTAHPRFYRQIRPTLHMGNIRKEKDGLEGVLSGSRPGSVIVAHLWHRPEWEQLLDDRVVPHLLMIRDPRDVAISLAHYITKNTKHHEHRVFQNLPDTNARLALVITGDETKEVPSLRDRLEPFFPWISGNTLLIRFEDLVGSAGGGDDQTQYETVRCVFSKLGVVSTDTQISLLAEKTFSRKSPTFRKGKINQWKEVFTPGITKLFDDYCPDLLSNFGYE